MEVHEEDLTSGPKGDYWVSESTRHDQSKDLLDMSLALLINLRTQHTVSVLWKTGHVLQAGYAPA